MIDRYTFMKIHIEKEENKLNELLQKIFRIRTFWLLMRLKTKRNLFGSYLIRFSSFRFGKSDPFPFKLLPCSLLFTFNSFIPFCIIACSLLFKLLNAFIEGFQLKKEFFWSVIHFIFYTTIIILTSSPFSSFCVLLYRKDQVRLNQTISIHLTVHIVPTVQSLLLWIFSCVLSLFDICGLSPFQAHSVYRS